mmetsp:Transcript_4586/g.6964  ORF Transcript_4586/g.6964 Transcript_4586/m.6964 type:complete len:321 (-) Transcript_4586:8-970(-)
MGLHLIVHGHAVVLFLHDVPLLDHLVLLFLQLVHHFLHDFFPPLLALFFVRAGELVEVLVLRGLLPLVLFPDPLLFFNSSANEGVGREPLDLEHRAVVEVVKMRQISRQVFPVLRDEADAGVALQVEGRQRLQLREEGDNVLFVVDLVVLQVQVGQLRQVQQFLTSFCVGNDVPLQIQVLEVNKAPQVLNFFDAVGGQIQHSEVGEVVQILDLRDLVLLHENHLQLGLLLKALDAHDSVGFQPDTLQVDVVFNILNSAEALEVQVEGVVQRGSRKLAVLFAELFDEGLGEHVVAVLVFVHVDDMLLLVLDVGGFEAGHCA